MDYKVDAKKLKEVFKIAGRIHGLDLSLDKEGNSRGFAVIEYDHPVEAVQAISMFDRQMLFDRRMTVRLDRIPDKGEGVKLPEGLRGIGIGLGPNGEPLKNVASNLPSLQQNQNNPSQNVSSMMDNSSVGALGSIGNPSLPSNTNLTNQLAALNNVFGNLSGGSLPNSLLSTAANLNNLGLNLGGGNNDLPNTANPNSVGYNQSSGGNNYNSGFASGNLGSARSDFDLGGNTGSVRNYNTRPQDDFGRSGGGGNLGNIGGFMNNGNNSVNQQRSSDTIVIKNVSNLIFYCLFVSLT